MRYQLAIFALALSISSTSAQSITDVPQCAYAAALKSIGSSKCNLTEIKCICQSSDWITTLLPEVSKDCSPADLEKTRTVTLSLCKNEGIDLVLPSGTTGTISQATATSAAKSTASSAATSASSIVASLASSVSTAVATATGTGSATTFGPQSGLLGMMGIAMGMMVL